MSTHCPGMAQVARKGRRSLKYKQLEYKLRQTLRNNNFLDRQNELFRRENTLLRSMVEGLEQILTETKKIHNLKLQIALTEKADQPDADQHNAAPIANVIRNFIFLILVFIAGVPLPVGSLQSLL